MLSNVLKPHKKAGVRGHSRACYHWREYRTKHNLITSTITYKYLLLKTLKIAQFLSSAEFCPHILLSFLLIFIQREQTPQCCLCVFFFSFWIFLSHPYISLVQLLSCATSFQMPNQALKKATYFFHISHFLYEIVKFAKFGTKQVCKVKKKKKFRWFMSELLINDWTGDWLWRPPKVIGVNDRFQIRDGLSVSGTSLRSWRFCLRARLRVARPQGKRKRKEALKQNRQSRKLC